MSDHDELGTGQIETRRDITVVHFGSPQGTNYTTPNLGTTSSKPEHPATRQPMYRLTRGNP